MVKMLLYSGGLGLSIDEQGGLEMKGKINKIKDTVNDHYIYPLTVAEAVYVDTTTSLKEKLLGLDQKLGYIPSAYFIDLNRWGIVNKIVDASDKQQAKANSVGINSAIQWASAQGYAEIILPFGNYLIDEYSPIVPANRMTLNLNGATLRIRNNGYDNYCIIYIRSQNNVKVINGLLEGDREFHDYSSGGTHEGCAGIRIGDFNVNIQLDNPERIELLNLEIFNCTGDCIAFGLSPNFQIGYNLKEWEQGSIHPLTGININDSTKIRLKNKLMLNSESIKKFGYFTLSGNGWGDLGTEIKSRVIDVLFYDVNDNILTALTSVKIFDEIHPPPNAAYARIVLYQAHIPDQTTSNTVLLSVAVPLYSNHIYIEKCHLHHSKRCGISGTGKFIYIKNNNIHDIAGTAPQAAIDIEDGYELNQYYFIDGNHIYDCKIGVSIVNTKHVVMTNNVMERLGPSQVWGRSQDIKIDNNHYSKVVLIFEGDVIFTNNKLYLCRVSSKKSTACLISHNFFHNSSLNITKDSPYLADVVNCVFYHDEESKLIAGQQPTFFYGKEPQSISHCIFNGQTSALNTVTGQNDAYGWRMTNCTFHNTKPLRLPAGTIQSCEFDQVSTLGLLKDATYEFADCKFSNWDQSNYLFYLAEDHYLARLTIRNSSFIGANKPAAFMRNIKGSLELVNNSFEYNNTADNFIIFDFWVNTFTCRYLLIDGNRFKSAKPIVAVNLNRQLTDNVIFYKKNILETVTQPITSDQVYASNNYVNGVFEPYIRVKRLPDTGKYELGYVLNNSAPIPGEYQGWVCTAAGYACNQERSSKSYFNQRDRIFVGTHVYEAIFPGNTVSAPIEFKGFSGEIVMDINQNLGVWEANKAYQKDEIIKIDGLDGIYFKCTVAGISSHTEPVWNRTVAQTTKDNSVVWTTVRLLTWKEIGNKAEFRPYGKIMS